MDELILVAHKRLLTAIFGGFNEDDLLPLRECDVVRINETLKSLDEQEGGRLAGIIRLRFGLNDGVEHTLAAIGKVYGVSYQRIRQQEIKAMNGLRHSSRRTAFQKLFRSFLENRSDSLEEYDPHWHRERIRQLERQLAGRIKIIKSLLNMSEIKGREITTLELSVRADRCLREAEIFTIADLIKKNKNDLLLIRGMGRKTVNEIRNLLSELGLDLNMDNNPLNNDEGKDLSSYSGAGYPFPSPGNF